MKRIAVMALALLVMPTLNAAFRPLEADCASTTEASIVIVIREPEEVQHLWEASGGTIKVLAFTTTGPDGRKVLVLPPLQGQDDRETMRLWGHELAHVACGYFHGQHAAY